MDDLSNHEADLDFTRDVALATVTPVEWPASPDEVEIGSGASGGDGYDVVVTRRERKPRTTDGPRIVLVIDSDDNVRAALEHYLGKDGYAMRTAATRRQIQAGLQAAPLPDLIFLEVDMPDADGFDLLDKFHKSKVVGSVPVIMLTSRSSRKDIAKALSLGAAGYLTKPVKVPVIIDALQAVLG